jgi:hypothetical protein
MHIVSLIIALQKRASCQFVAFVRFQYPHLVAHLRKNVLFCSKASKVEQALVIGLGAFNLVGVIVLSGMLRDYSLVQQLRGSGLIPFATKILPLLQAYTATFFAIPAFRWFALQQKNAEIEKRNRARLGWVAALERAGLDLRAKLKSAREMAKQTVIGRERVIYSTEKDLAVQDYEAQEWEQRLKERS